MKMPGILWFTVQIYMICNTINALKLMPMSRESEVCMEKYYHTSQVTPDEDVLYTTCKTLLAEGVVVVPTDSVYGIACAVTNNNHGYRRY